MEILNREEINKVESDVKNLAQQIHELGLDVADTCDALKELVENEFISEAIYFKLMEGEKLRCISQLKAFHDIYKGFN